MKVISYSPFEKCSNKNQKQVRYHNRNSYSLLSAFSTSQKPKKYRHSHSHYIINNANIQNSDDIPNMIDSFQFLLLNFLPIRLRTKSKVLRCST